MSDSYEYQLADNENEFFNKNEKLRKNIEDLNNCLEELKNQNLNLEERNRRLVSSCGGYESKNKKVKIELEELQSQLAIINEKYDSLRNLFEISEERVNLYAKALEAYRKSIDEYLKPTSIEVKNSNRKVDNSKIIDTERKNKTACLKNRIKQIDETLMNDLNSNIG